MIPGPTTTRGAARSLPPPPCAFGVHEMGDAPVVGAPRRGALPHATALLASLTEPATAMNSRQASSALPLSLCALRSALCALPAARRALVLGLCFLRAASRPPPPVRCNISHAHAEVFGHWRPQSHAAAMSSVRHGINTGIQSRPPPRQLHRCALRRTPCPCIAGQPAFESSYGCHRNGKNKS